ncbi:MAG: DUF3098 domain-containing protein [Rikenellaceae bacterium]|nr:DUF3098 domain-containing protein [Rikenellaceae bacterium]
MEKMTKEEEQGKFAIPYKNIIFVVAGVVLMLLGYALMTGGGTTDPSVFTGEKMFSFRRIVLSPLIILVGVVVEIYAIMYTPKEK